MATTFFDVNNAYSKNKNLREEDVKNLTHWVQNQPHLPEINEAQAVLFLHRWQYKLELAKAAVDTYFTFRTHYSDVFPRKSLLDPQLKQSIDISLYTVLPQKSYKGYSVYLAKMVIPDLSRYFVKQLMKTFDMVLSLDLYQKGTSDVYIVLFDVNCFTLDMIAKSDLVYVKTFFYYLQKVTSAKFKEWHMINPVPYLDKVLAIIKPFLEKELADQLYIHQNIAGLFEHVPQSGLPRDYGGSEGSLAELHVQMKQKILENVTLFDWEDGQIVDESKRFEKSSNVINYLERACIRNGKFEID